MDENKAPDLASEHGGDADEARRKALRTLGKAAFYTAPAVIATLTAAKAAPVSVG